MSSTQDEGQNDSYYNLGTYHRDVSTSSPTAQLWFDRGLIWSYAFNHEESARCFERAINADPNLAIAYWGLAYASGPNYNKPWETFDDIELKQSIDKIKETNAKAIKIAEDGKSVTLLEKALIEAVQVRLPKELNEAEYKASNKAYANAMKPVYERFGDDLDIAALYADALMNITPWELWDLKTGKVPPEARTLEAETVLEKALKQNGAYSHPGLLHLYVHLMEMSARPEDALVVADHLRGLVPDAGHLQHMPTHLDILIGDYRRAIEWNAHAEAADAKFVEREGEIEFYTFYTLHNHHMLIYAAMFAGQLQPALTAVAKMEAELPEALLRTESPPMADWLESFVPVRTHILVRFGRWQELIDMPFPEDQKLYCVHTANLHYAKGVAYAATNQIQKAEEQRELLQQAAARVPASRMQYPNKCSDTIDVSIAMLDGEIAYRKGDYVLAFRHLARSVELDDSLIYCEPWSWMQPTRHAYAALLMEQGHFDKALHLYAEDLGYDESMPRARQHPNNVFALHGYHECLVTLGRTDEARIVWQQLRVALALADVEIKSSCYCRGAVKADGCC